MSYLVILIIDEVDDCHCILEEWEALGVTGVTILESSGLGRLRKAGERDDLSIMPSLREIFSGREVPHRTLLSVVDSQELVDQMVETAQNVIGDLNEPHTGFLFVVPVLQAYGLGKELSRKE